MDMIDSTFLSENVYHMVCGLNKEYEDLQMKQEPSSQANDVKIPTHEMSTGSETFITDGQLLSLTLHSVLGKEEVNSMDYEAETKRLLPMCHLVHNRIMQMKLEEFSSIYGPKFEWTGLRKRMLECYDFLKSKNPVHIMTALLVLTSSLEHCLGDIYLSSSEATQCPMHMKDLLAKTELKDAFGNEIMHCLHVLIGPPTGLNLRNILWHGFSAPLEIPPQFGSFLLVLTASMNENTMKMESRDKIQYRPLLLFPKKSLLYEVFPQLKADDISSIQWIFKRSQFVSPSMLPVWLMALEFFCKERYDLASILLLPQLEHALRLVYTRVNNCPQRALTAETTALYTTFDEILAQFMPDGSPNAIRAELGDSYLEMLLDMLVHPEGPRVRDHISHGEVHLDDFPPQLANHVICVCVAFAALYLDNKCQTHEISFTKSDETKVTETADMIGASDLHKISKGVKVNTLHGDSLKDGLHTEISTANNLETLSLNGSTIIHRIVAAAETYEPIFHSIQILKRNIMSFCKSLLAWEELKQPDRTELEDTHLNLTTDHSLLKTLEHFLPYTKSSDGISNATSPGLVESEQNNIYLECITSALNTKVHTLYRPRSELEIVSLLSSIVQHCKKTAEQVLTMANQRYVQWERKELRSRQRANYQRLLAILPFIRDVLKLVVVSIAVELPNISNGGSPYIKFLKRCLQCVENMESLSSPTKNKWDDCHKVGINLVKIIQKQCPEKESQM